MYSHKNHIHGNSRCMCEYMNGSPAEGIRAIVRAALSVPRLLFDVHLTIKYPVIHVIDIVGTAYHLFTL